MCFIDRSNEHGSGWRVNVPNCSPPAEKANGPHGQSAQSQMTILIHFKMKMITQKPDPEYKSEFTNRCGAIYFYFCFLEKRSEVSGMKAIFNCHGH